MVTQTHARDSLATRLGARAAAAGMVACRHRLAADAALPPPLVGSVNPPTGDRPWTYSLPLLSKLYNNCPC